ncbi:AraC family transcriptional regulator [Photobacterium aquae]|uniref:AraC family transcriptional regulator n=1 Tax=Photobacterium aquae TaxID=1195763 RepID=A0A0J1H129_9GAMM|nr:AraC family transcriptional regulator [Photobacterium aquae]KLV05509.1 AraC family transcriptional regulator [Photobacterium aquae]
MPAPQPIFDAAFTRTLFLKPFLQAVNKQLGVDYTQLGIPASLAAEPMALVPYHDVNRWLEQIETELGDPSYVAKIAPWLKLDNMDRLGNWFLSTPELALSFRRINYGTSCLQSGATFHGELSGRLIKWCYDNHFSSGRGRLHDSLRIAIMLTNTVRYFMGENYSPLKVEISGPRCDAVAFEEYFGCPIRWNAPKTKVWIDISILEHGNTQPFQFNRPIMLSNLDMDEFLNMPQPHDAAKVMYEMINYSRYYGYPSLDFVAGKFQLSKQQLQRRLHQFGWSFTSITSYVLCNQAIKYMQTGMPVKEIAQSLGYRNVQSFSKAFQRQRGQTPHQYQETLLERCRF